MQKECYTEQYGTRQCMLAVRENLMQKCHVKLDEPVIEQVLRFKKADISQRIQDVIVDSATVYTQGIVRKLREHDYNPEIMRLYVVAARLESLWDSKFRAWPETADGRIGNSSAAPQDLSSRTSASTIPTG